MAYKYTNRQGKTHYFRAVKTKTGKYRYYVTTSEEYPNLIDAIPEEYEVVELPEDARVVIRKIKPTLINSKEKEIVYQAIRDFSAIKDFFIHTEEEYISVYHSALNYEAGIEPNLSREEAIEQYGDGIERWLRFFCAMRFKLVDSKRRIFQAERIVRTGFFAQDFYQIGEPGLLENLARAFGQHLGRDSFYDIEPHGWIG